MALHEFTRVPESIMGHSPRDRLEGYYDKVSIDHPKFNEVYDAIEQYADYSDDKIIFALGPTGIGKSHLADRFVRRRIEREINYRSYFEPSSYAPILYLKAGTSGTGFSWPHFYRRAINRFNVDPTVMTRSKIPSESSDFGGRYSTRAKNANDGQDELIRRFIDYKTKYWVIDEAADIFKYSGKAGDSDLSTLKHIADVAGVRLILFGLYDASTAIGEDGQLNRRTKVFSFENYERGSKDFERAYVTLLMHVPFSINQDLFEDMDFIYAGSCGCIGVLRDWLFDAQKDLINRDDDCLAMEHMHRSHLTFKALKKIAQEIRDHKSFVEGGSMNDILELLDSGISIDPDNQSTKLTSKRKRGSKVGVPKPERVPL